MRKTCGKEQSGRFADHAAGCQNTAGDDTVDAAGQNHGSNHMPFAGTESECAFAISLRNGFKAFLNGTDNGRQVHDYQS